MAAPPTPAASRPGAMSLLDKYASINTSIDDARRRAAAVRADLDTKNERIATLAEERTSMLAETEAANAEKSKLEADLAAAREEHASKLSERERAEREYQLAMTQYNGMRRRVDDERRAFLERGREFRASVKRMRVAASLHVLDGGSANFDAKDATDKDLWRTLEEEQFSDDDDDDGGESNNDEPTKRKTPDPAMDRAEHEEKETRDALLEAECALHAARTAHAAAVAKGNARAQKLAQQRAQLARHRSEVEALEREVQGVKDEVVEQNQLANAFEKRVYQRRQRENNAREARNNGSYSNNFHPPHEATAGNTARGNDPYSHRTPQTAAAPTNQQPRPRAVANPYAKPSRQNSGSTTPLAYRQGRKAPTPPRASSGPGGRTATAPQYASELLDRSWSGSAQRNARQTAQHPHRGRNVRNQRQFGTSVGVSLDDGMSSELRECMAGFDRPASGMAAKDSDNMSDISSTSSDDEELLSFNIFGKK